MKQFTPTPQEVKNLQAEKSVGLIDAKSILTGRNVVAELQDIAAKIEYGVHADHTAQQLARLTDVILFMVTNGSIKF
jgi:hypothetical protein